MGAELMNPPRAPGAAGEWNTADAMRRRQEKRERLLTTIEFGRPDRMPVRGGCGAESAIAAITGRDDYQQHPKDVYAEAHRIWDVDLITQFVLPDRLDRQVGAIAEVDITALRGYLPRTISEWKKRHGPFSSPEGFRDFCRQLPDARTAGGHVDCDRVAEQWLALDRWGDFLAPAVWIPGHLAGTCRWMWYSAVGYENYLMAHMLYPEAVDRLFAFNAEEGRRQNEVIARTIRRHNLVPLIYSGEDICDNSGPLCRPSLLHDLYFPHLKRALAPLIEAGVHWMWHSDGNITPILDDLLACGIDGFQGFEEDKGMDLNALLGRTGRNGNHPFICGSVSVTTTFYQDPAAVAADKARMQRVFDQQGGVILGSSSTIMADTPVENILEFYRRN